MSDPVRSPASTGTTPNTHREPPMPEKPMSPTNARQGVTLGHMRWVLLISLILVVAGMAIAYFVAI
jgi:hypothetical protein